jgi:hypothetical protein
MACHSLQICCLQYGNSAGKVKVQQFPLSLRTQ